MSDETDAAVKRINCQHQPKRVKYLIVFAPTFYTTDRRATYVFTHITLALCFRTEIMVFENAAAHEDQEFDYVEPSTYVSCNQVSQLRPDVVYQQPVSGREDDDVYKEPVSSVNNGGYVLSSNWTFSTAHGLHVALKPG